MSSLLLEQVLPMDYYYGVCVNSKCVVSSLRPELERLYKALDIIDRLLQNDESVQDLLPHLTAFTGYFQSAPACTRCGRAVEHSSRPVTGITNQEERTRIELLNEALQASRRLQALGVDLSGPNRREPRLGF